MLKTDSGWWKNGFCWQIIIFFLVVISYFEIVLRFIIGNIIWLIIILLLILWYLRIIFCINSVASIHRLIWLALAAGTRFKMNLNLKLSVNGMNPDWLFEKKKNAGWPTSFFFSPKNWKQTTTKQKPGSDFFFSFLFSAAGRSCWFLRPITGDAQRSRLCRRPLDLREEMHPPPPHPPSLPLHWKATKAADCLDVQQLPLPSWPPAGRQLPQTRNASHNEGSVS